MKNKITLSNPLTINNKKRTELTYDANEITAQMFAEADARKLTASGSKNGNAAGAAELVCTSTSASRPSSPSTPRST